MRPLPSALLLTIAAVPAVANEPAQRPEPRERPRTREPKEPRDRDRDRGRCPNGCVVLDTYPQRCTTHGVLPRDLPEAKEFGREFPGRVRQIERQPPCGGCD